MDLKRIHAYLTLNHIEHHASMISAPILEQGYDVEEIVQFPANKWEEFFSKRKVSRIISVSRECKVEELLEKMVESKVGLLPLEDEDYPSLLREIYNPPILLHYLGKLPPKDSVHIAVVGSREASLQGRSVAEDLGVYLARHGIGVVSGFARGIDRAAHKGVVSTDPQGYAIGVIGSGLNDFLKPRLYDLYEKVLKNGMILTEFPLMYPAKKQNFPLRNRVITGICLATVLVEARMRSGSMVSARLAIEQGREVFAVPGPIHAQGSEGTNHLIRSGANLLSSFKDLFIDLNLPLKESPKIELSPEHQEIFEKISASPMPVEELLYHAQISFPRLAKILVELEERGMVKRHPGDLISATRAS